MLLTREDWTLVRVLSPPVRGVGKRSGLYPRIQVNGAGNGVVTQAGGALLTATIRALGLDAALSAVLARWRKPLAIHDPAKVLLDLAVALGLGGDCLPASWWSARSRRYSGWWPPTRRSPGRSMLAVCDTSEAGARPSAEAGASAAECC